MRRTLPASSVASAIICKSGELIKSSPDCYVLVFPFPELYKLDFLHCAGDVLARVRDNLQVAESVNASDGGADVMAANDIVGFDANAVKAV